MARSAFHHSMNYRSVMIFGVPRFVSDRDEKMAAFEAVTEHVAPGRWADTRHPDEKEMKGTLIVALDLDESSAKVRTGGPVDDEADYELPHWAGVVPVRQTFDPPIADENALRDVPIPAYLSGYERP